MLREAGRILLGQAVADGFLTGAILALGALGASLSLQILRFANFSHAELLTWGGYIALTFTTFATVGTSIGPLSFGWQLLLALLIVGTATGMVALAVDRLVFRQLRARHAHNLTMVFASFGVALILRNVVLLLWGPDAHYYSDELQISIEVLPGIRLLPDQVFVRFPRADRAIAAGDGVQSAAGNFYGGDPGRHRKPVRRGDRGAGRGTCGEPVAADHTVRLQGRSSVRAADAGIVFPTARPVRLGGQRGNLKNAG